ncbi:aminoglycoside phosphotransferase family protein [Actinomadura violacea]|uniref:Phosphotransferase n=1 Tax=Actinomadura violacea TaxID=2819934 RepID=A0ABS3RN06_9ACTN|nr:aminoglycoside phosphotransferase family protein [Actinomadura violacea]MBO2458137.1 phosphotransferase [Actinomadura violacea]
MTCTDADAQETPSRTGQDIGGDADEIQQRRRGRIVSVMATIPTALAEAIVRREGEAGRQWIAALPTLVTRFIAQWGCESAGAPWHGEMAIALPVVSAHGSGVLKISFPRRSSQAEAAALRCFAGRGAVRVLESDDDAVALLLERAGPQTLASVPSVEETIEIAGGLARRLALPAPAGFPSLASATHLWERQLLQQAAVVPGQLPVGAVDRARDVIRELAADTTLTMLHGDLHYGNILKASREPWLAVDPQGRRGTAAFDAFTVIAERSSRLEGNADPRAAILARIRRYSMAADVDAELALACCQARATSAYLHQRASNGDWFDLDFLRHLIAI